MIAIGIAVLLGAMAVALVLSGVRSAAALLFYFAFLPFATLDPSQGGLVEASAALSGGNALWKLAARAIGMAGVAALAAVRARDIAQVVLRPASLPILFLVVWAVLGLPRASDPWVAFFRLGELFAFFVAGTLLFVEVTERLRTHDALRLHALALLAPLVGAVVFAHAFPEVAFHESSSGLRRMGHKFMNSNVLGFCAAAVALWSVYVLRARLVLPAERPSRREQAVALLALALAAYVLYHARSRTAALTLACGQFVLWFPWPRVLAVPGSNARRAQGAALVAVLATAAVTLFLGGAFVEWFLRGADAADVASGTGRTGLWRDLLDVRVPEAPLLGSGYLNLSPEGTFEHAGHRWNNAHNTYLFALVSTGVPGLLAVCLIVFLPLRGAFRAMAEGDAADRSAATLLFAFQCAIAVASVTGFGVSGYPNVAMLFHYGLYAYATRPLVSAAPQTARSIPSPAERSRLGLPPGLPRAAEGSSR